MFMLWTIFVERMKRLPHLGIITNTSKWPIITIFILFLFFMYNIFYTLIIKELIQQSPHKPYNMAH